MTEIVRCYRCGETATDALGGTIYVRRAVDTGYATRYMASVAICVDCLGIEEPDRAPVWGAMTIVPDPDE